MPFYVVKMGGSLMANARSLVRSLMDLGNECFRFLVVPGGGPMADMVREIHSRGELSDEAAHWMAVLAMEQYAYFLSDGTGAALTDEIRRPKGVCPVEILLPYTALSRDDRGIEHSWDYTSDAIALLAAAKLSADLIKATDVDGVILDGKVAMHVHAARLIGSESCIDQGSLRLLCESLHAKRIIIINGTDRERFVKYVRLGLGGTVITS
ncbi:MAG: uridylate kinase [Methanothrix sp.]|jgi:hypothetical protein|nr:uridylate kinase [Methanothrix sp.]